MWFRFLIYLTSLSLLGISGCQHHPSDPSIDEHTYQLVYELHGSQLFVINDDGSEKRILNVSGAGAKWSPQEDRIAFLGSTDQPGFFLCTIRSDGSDFRPITLAALRGVTNTLDWSPDGKQLVFFTTKYHAFGFAAINVDGSNERNLTPEGFWRTVAWSPKEKIALEGAPKGKQPSIYMVNPDGTGMYNLVDAFAVSPLWRPDGKKIEFTIGTPQDTAGYFQFNTYVCNPDGSNLQQITYNGEVGADWSPDGSKLLYLFHPEEIAVPAFASVGIMNADGSEPRVWLEAGEHHGFLFPRFSPDGRKIAYVRVSNTGTGDSGELWVMNADGSDRRKLDGHGQPIGGPIFYDWSPN